MRFVEKTSANDPALRARGRRRQKDRPSTSPTRVELPFRWRRLRMEPGGANEQVLKGLILAQSERWRRGLGMQVVRKGPPPCRSHRSRRAAGVSRLIESRFERLSFELSLKAIVFKDMVRVLGGGYSSGERDSNT